MPLSDKLDEVLALSRRFDSAEHLASSNVPFGQVDPATIKAELEAAKKELLEDCLSKSETVRYLRELQAVLKEIHLRDTARVEDHPEYLNAQRAESYSEAAERYVRSVADDIERGHAVPNPPIPPNPPSHVFAPK